MGMLEVIGRGGRWRIGGNKRHDPGGNIHSATATCLHTAIKPAVGDRTTSHRRRGDARATAILLNSVYEVLLGHTRIRDYSPQCVKGLLSPSLKSLSSGKTLL